MTRKWRKGLLLAVALMLISAQADSAPRIKYLKPGKDSLADDQVSTIVFDKSNVWIGTYRGLSLYNKRSGKWRTFRQKQGLPHRHVTALALDGGVIWVGTRYGLVRMDKKTFKTKSVILDISTPTLQTRQVREVAKKGQLIDQYILSIAVDGDQLWVGTGNGAALYDKKTGKSKEVRYWGDLFHDDYLDIKVETSKVWVAANRAFAVYDKNTRDWTVHATSLSDKTWRNLMGGNDLAVDKDYVWIATHAGVARYDKGARQLGMYTVKGGKMLKQRPDRAGGGPFPPLLLEQGNITSGDKPVATLGKVLSHNFCWGVVSVGQKLWIATENGLNVLDKKTGRVKVYTKNDGLLDDRVFGVYLDGRSIWATTKGGINILPAK